MNITITFRQMESTPAVKQFASEKVGKLQKFLRQPMTAKVTLSLDRLRHRAEVRISSGGEHLEAHEHSDDMYASIDRVIAKLERQIRGSKGAQAAKKQRATLRRAASAPADVASPADAAMKAPAKPKKSGAKTTKPRAGGRAAAAKT